MSLATPLLVLPFKGTDSLATLFLTYYFRIIAMEEENENNWKADILD